jgi:cytochrome oxidase Cu insertion factor (SCO1/SenC/PrrC family)
MMEDYVLHFDPSFLGLVPRNAQELERVTSAYNIYYERIDYGSEVGYLMDHTTSVTLIDERGVWRGIYSFDAPPEEIAADLKYLVGQMKKGR